MDLIKIGKFIADCRKSKNITQEELAEKLFITDRAVSKWERGLSLPDADKMLDLCNILDINVNELLCGEKIDMKDNNKKTEELLVEMAKQDELKNKKLMRNMFVMVFSSLAFYLGVIYLAQYAFGEGKIFGIIMFVSTVLFIAICFYGFKIEVDTGFYECTNCHEKYIPKYLSALLAPHVHTTRLLKCPHCNQRVWAKKVMTKD